MNFQRGRPNEFGPRYRLKEVFVLQNPGAYTVRYLFVILAFSFAETENLRGPFLLGRAPERDHLEPF